MDALLENVLREVEMLPEEERRRIAQVIEAEVRRSRDAAPRPEGRWARFADRMATEAPMRGRSEEFLKRAREFRDGFDLGTRLDRD